MHRIRAGSAPDLSPVVDAIQEYDDSALEGLAAHVKLLLKLIQDHKDATNNNRNDGRKMLRVATMMTILDNVRSRIQKCQFKSKRSEAELRRCNSNSDLTAPRHVPRDRKQVGDHQNGEDEKERLKKALNASLAARKSLEIMCSGLGKEKKIMSIELAKRIHLMNEMEELIGNLKVQNRSLSDKVRECASEHSEKRGTGGAVGETQGNSALQDRNRALSEHLQTAIDGYRSMKKKAKELYEENVKIRATMEETRKEVKASLERLSRFKESIASGTDPPTNIEVEITRLEHVFECFERQILNQNQKKGECVKPKGEINACSPSIFA